MRNLRLQSNPCRRRSITMAITTAFILSSGVLMAEPPPRPEAGLPPGLDSNADQRVDRAEFADDLQRRFADADSNADGHIDAQELAAAEQRREARAEMEREQRRLQRLDSNRDGLVDSAEFEADAWQYFQAMDIDGDGAVDSSEWHPPGPPPRAHPPGRAPRTRR